MSAVTPDACFELVGEAFGELPRLRKISKGFQKRCYDLGSHRLRFGPHTPFYWIQTEIDQLDAELVQELRSQSHPAILLCPRSAHFTEFKGSPLAFIDPHELALSESGKQTEAMILGSIRRDISLNTLSPYEVSAPVFGEQFFGREAELETIKKDPKRSYILYGARRIGKTSMLVQLQHLYNERIFSPNPKSQNYGSAQFISCLGLTTYKDLTEVLLSYLTPSEYWRGKGFVRTMRRQASATVSTISHFRAIAKPYTAGILLLMDEIDGLIEGDHKEEILWFLRQLSDNGYRMVMTGYRAVWDEMQEFPGMLWNFAPALYVRQFSKRESFEMISVPIRSMGVELEEGVVRRIYQETGGIPNYMQHYCHVIVSQAQEPGVKVGMDVFDAIYTHQDFDFHIMNSFHQNVTEPLAKLIVYSVAKRNVRRFVVKEVVKFAKASKVSGVNYEDVRTSANYLAAMGFLEREEADTYNFLAPIVLDQLRKRDLDRLLEKVLAALRTGKR